MSFIKMFPRLANLKYFPLVLSLILIIPFTPVETHAIYGGDYINRISIPYRKGGVKTLSFLTGFTLLPIIPSSHFLIISFPPYLIYSFPHHPLLSFSPFPIIPEKECGNIGCRPETLNFIKV